MSISEFDTVDYDFAYEESYAALELNRWALDGNTVIAPASGELRDGFISSHMSNADGEFETHAVLTRQFSQPRIFPGITLTFDTRYREWPFSVTVRFYLDGDEVDTQTVPVTDSEVVVNTGAEQVDKIT